MRRFLAAIILLSCIAWPVLAVQPDEILEDPALEARAREISRNLRCLVCQNQSIDDSNAELARDLRILVRERLKAGDSNEEVVAYVTARYGDFVLLRPPVKTGTYLLWFGPLLLLLFAGGAIALRARRRAKSPDAEAVRPLSAEERKRLDALLKDE